MPACWNPGKLAGSSWPTVLKAKIWLSQDGGRRRPVYRSCVKIAKEGVLAIRYLDRDCYEPSRFLRDLNRTAAAVGAPFDEARVRRSLEVFDTEFSRQVVQLKVTSESGGALFYRFFMGSFDLVETAFRYGLIGWEATRGPLGALQHQLLEAFPQAAPAGLDFNSGVGLAKSWTFLGRRRWADLLHVAAFPRSMRAASDLLDRLSLDTIFFVACDFQHESVNVYSLLDGGQLDPGWLRRLLVEMAGPREVSAGPARLLDALANGATLGMTFSWNNDEMLRWALYGLNVPYLSETARVALPTLPPRLRTFLAHAPTLSLDPQVNVAWSFGRAGFYMKLEKSYAKNVPAARASGDAL